MLLLIFSFSNPGSLIAAACEVYTVPADHGSLAVTADNSTFSNVGC